MNGTEWLLVSLLAAVAVVTLAIAVRLLVTLVRTRRVLRDAGIPASTRTMFWASVAYLVWPVDVLPDPVYLDDIGFLLLALRSLHAAARHAGVTGTGTGRARRDTGRAATRRCEEYGHAPQATRDLTPGARTAASNGAADACPQPLPRPNAPT